MTYKHLTLEDRYYIATRNKLGNAASVIAKALGCDQTTISRELLRNAGQRGYGYKQADTKAKRRHIAKAIRLTTALTADISAMLMEDWSPEQISRRLAQAGKPTVCHETIYRHILKYKQADGKLYRHLRRHTKKYSKRYGSRTGSRMDIPNRVDIDARPEVVGQRGRLGDWEADIMIGKGYKGVLVTLDERKSKLRLALPAAHKTAEAVTSAIIAAYFSPKFC